MGASVTGHAQNRDGWDGPNIDTASFDLAITELAQIQAAHEALCTAAALDECRAPSAWQEHQAVRALCEFIATGLREVNTQEPTGDIPITPVHTRRMETAKALFRRVELHDAKVCSDADGRRALRLLVQLESHNADVGLVYTSPTRLYALHDARVYLHIVAYEDRDDLSISALYTPRAFRADIQMYYRRENLAAIIPPRETVVLGSVLELARATGLQHRPDFALRSIRPNLSDDGLRADFSFGSNYGEMGITARINPKSGLLTFSADVEGLID